MEMLFKARGDADYTIHLTYPIDEIDKARQADWKKEQNKERKRKLTNPKQDDTARLVQATKQPARLLRRARGPRGQGADRRREQAARHRPARSTDDLNKAGTGSIGARGNSLASVGSRGRKVGKACGGATSRIPTATLTARKLHAYVEGEFVKNNLSRPAIAAEVGLLHGRRRRRRRRHRRHRYQAPPGSNSSIRPPASQ